MSDNTQLEKKLKTWDEAIKELGAFIKASKEKEAKEKQQEESNE